MWPAPANVHFKACVAIGADRQNIARRRKQALRLADHFGFEFGARPVSNAKPFRTCAINAMRLAGTPPVLIVGFDKDQLY